MLWPGGSWAATESSSQQISGNGSYVFPSTAQMVADVQGWLDQPSGNFGWALVMPSPPVGSAKRFNSRENSSQNTRPKLPYPPRSSGVSAREWNTIAAANNRVEVTLIPELL